MENRGYHDRYTWAQSLFGMNDYRGAIKELESLLAELAVDEDAGRAGVTDARLLLARAYFHSASLGRAESTARAVLAEDPTDAYAALLLARTLERQARPEEAQMLLRRAAVLGAPGTSLADLDR
ncbi:hypothetical protein [Nocardioides bruguierae]|uniref:Tetratricopeptide repeat protein n=1 Tax=Nocardioides bruguierae TaxID=2945102 RepID=A0A9X2D8U7_9ACTN|nr:hypothetical protein [Nocardioides bruguierae]MCL8026134.1 hypothetical protein [Nocardioides bruguierae]MCM0621478.1 hypothetical protein [Nocardioides bruguierae]